MIKRIPYFLIVLFVLALILTPFFIKVRIECKSQYGGCPDEINAKLSSLNDKSLFQMKNNASKILKKDFLVSAFSTQFKLPDILLINIIVKKPYFAIKNADSGNYELIDQKGMVLEMAGSSSLPTVIVSEQPQKVGGGVSDTDLYALNLISGVSQMYQVGYGTITNDTLVVDMGTGVRVIFPLEGEDPEVLLGAFRLIYTKVSSNYLGIYSQIDMRYKNPVLR
jgi:hypothetical protein